MNTLNKVEVKAGILNTIAKSIYSDFRIKTREAVSNSLDNKASSFILSVDSNNSIISFFDDGTGISQAFFQEIFTSIGYGTTRHAETTNFLLWVRSNVSSPDRKRSSNYIKMCW